MSSIACLTTQKLDCDACNMMPRAGTKDRSCGVGSSKGLREFRRLVLRGAAVAEIQWAAPIERANRRKAIGGYLWDRQIESASASASVSIFQYFKTAFAASLPIQAAFCPEA